jgi:hypothetical protein
MASATAAQLAGNMRVTKGHVQYVHAVMSTCLKDGAVRDVVVPGFDQVKLARHRKGLLQCTRQQKRN